MLATHYANIQAVEETTRRKVQAEFEKIIDHKACHMLINKLTAELELVRDEMHRVESANEKAR